MAEYLIYLRKSRQDDPNETVEEVLRKHEIQLQEYAKRKIGYMIPERDIYREIVSAETIQNRVEIKKVFERMEKEDIRGVLVIEPQRLTRGDLIDCGTTINAFRYTNTFIVTPTDTFDLNNEVQRKYVEMVLTSGNSFLEYSKIVLQRGVEASKRRGNFVSSVPPYGYKRVKIGKDWTLEPNDIEAMYVKLIFEMYAEGHGAYVIANKIEMLGATPRVAEHFTEGVIRQMLTNDVYRGKIKLNARKTVKVMENGVVVKKRVRLKDYEVVDGKHEAIIDDELWDAVQARMGNHTREAGKLELRNMWASLIKCSECGKAIEYVTFKKHGVKQRAPRLRCKNVRVCNNISHNYDEVHDAIIEQLKAKLEDFSIRVEDNNQTEINKRQEVLNSLKNRLADVNKKIDAICEHLENGVYTVDMFVDRNKKLSEEKLKIENAIKETEIEIPSMQEMHEQLVTFHQTLDMLNDDDISPKIKNTFLKKIIDVIYYRKDAEGITIDIHLKM